MATTIHDLIDQLRATSGSDAECGQRFERLMLAYLRTDPMWFSRFSKVWLWADWPDRQGEADTGIDLVAEHRDGSGVTAVQCKCYAATTTLDMKDLGTFFTRSGKPPFTERMMGAGGGCSCCSLHLAPLPDPRGVGLACPRAPLPTRRLRLLCRVVTVSMRTLDLVDALPPLDLG